MKSNMLKRFLRPALFTLGGALLGFLYYYFIGCTTGSCPLTSDPFISTLYGGVIGFLLSNVFTRK